MDKRTRIIVCAVLLAFALCMTAMAPYVSASAENSAPVAENLEIVTYRNVSVGGRLSAVDPDGDTVTYQITTEPTKGSIELTEDGRYVYTPDLNRRGRDYFGYKAMDSQGNLSQEATVIIKIQKQKTSVTYDDMSGNGSYYSAVRLVEEGIYTGEKVGSSYTFGPNEPVTRGEFLAMCMETCNAKTLTSVMSTGFLDDMSIPGWQKTYVATALMDGIVSGYSTGSGAYFDAEACISHSEAAVMIDNVMGLSDVSAIGQDITAPTWASQAAANLNACGIMSSTCVYDAELTRAEAADLLAAALDVLAARK